MIRETYNREYYECPVCHYKDFDAWELGLSDGEETEIECPSCGAKLVVSAEIVTWYTARLKENDDD